VAETFERNFYEVMWRAHARNLASANPLFPVPWWAQQYFRSWRDDFDGGLFLSKEGAFSSNACYRYWNMIGVKDANQESLIGQAGEIEPVYDAYSVSFFLFDPKSRRLAFPQSWHSDSGASLVQTRDKDYLPTIVTSYSSPSGLSVANTVMGTTVAPDQKSVVLSRYRVASPVSTAAWLCLAVWPGGPSGFQRNDRAGRYRPDRRISFLRYDAKRQLVEVNSVWGPVFLKAPDHYGVYGNPTGVDDPNQYLDNGPFADLSNKGSLNGAASASDFLAGMCTAVFAWDFRLTSGNAEEIDVLCPVDDFRGGDVATLLSQNPVALEAANQAFWTGKLNGSGAQFSLPTAVVHLWDLYRTCRAHLLILADDGAIHPGPTIYDEFWVRDSSIEGIAAALAGDVDLARRQFSQHYPDVFSFDSGTRGTPVSLRGFFGGPHEINDREWDSNGQALWAISRLDRLLGPGAHFGAGMYLPYVVEGARWLRDSRSAVGLLPQGWSAEHLGGKDETHYWDQFWAVAGLGEALKLAERIGANTAELQSTYDDVRVATRDSILWAIEEQRRRGEWRTFIPRSPERLGVRDSTIIGAVAYFHPCRLYMGQKLGADVDRAARATLETIWQEFMDGGFRHDAAWNCYGPYLTLQLAHAFLLTGDVDRMDACLRWSEFASRAETTSPSGSAKWASTLGAWNEQHCYPIAKNFAPSLQPPWWYMGDIPHGWACAEFMLLLRDIAFFEADEDGSPHVYVAPGVMAHWLPTGETFTIRDAPSFFGVPFGFELSHDAGAKTLTLRITQQLPAPVKYVLPCRFGSGPVSAKTVPTAAISISGHDVWLPAGTTSATVTYS
jgi:hypothetical protein